MRKIEVKIRGFFWSIKNTFKPTNYDIVVYQNKQYYIKTSLSGDNIWNLFEIDGKNIIHNRINGDDFKVVQSFNRFIRVFKK